MRYAVGGPEHEEGGQGGQDDGSRCKRLLCGPIVGCGTQIGYRHADSARGSDSRMIHLCPRSAIVNGGCVVR